ncbi:MAG TPA: SAM-dependent methyltransferase [Pseudonocardiaceae bacterium]|nr:SAM-dependent methyltransferase [Pseudonocardiaceae bacterium]
MDRIEMSSVEEIQRVLIDTSRPNLARCYDALLGGKDNYEIDRRFCAQLLAVAPGVRTLVRDNRGFLIRATRFLAAEAGVDQFLDLGSGLPTAENTHQVAQAINADARVVYVDNDPVVLAHGRALLADNDRTHFVAADFTEPEALLADETVRRCLDLSRPLALYQVGTLQRLADDQRPAELMAAYIDMLPRGSFVVLSHFFNPGEEDLELAESARALERMFLNGPMRGGGRFRARAQIAEYFTGLELIAPGLVVVGDWWPDGPRLTEPDPARSLMVGAVAVKR